MVSAFKVLLLNTGTDRDRERKREIKRKGGRQGRWEEGRKEIEWYNKGYG